MDHATLLEKADHWFAQQGWEAFPFQRQSWEAYLQGKSGLVNAPTGSGKTYALILPILLEGLRQQTADSQNAKPGLRALWITPIRALAREIEQATRRAIAGLGLDWEVELRTGDTTSSRRQKQWQKPPHILITTPESLHLLLAKKGYSRYFRQLRVVVADEWHELVGNKRGVMLELALSRLRGFLPDLKTWGISATIGNMDEAMDVLFGSQRTSLQPQLIRARARKQIEMHTILPDEVETFPWAGHLGITLLEKVIPLIMAGQSTLLFTNTRAQCEIWYQRLLEVVPELAGQLAMHHGSLDRKLRDWVENALHEGTLKAVVCTSSLDLGVDFRPVETIIQIGSPKGVARFLQRAGRSGHQPGATSRIYFVPTHSLEIFEGAALRRASREQALERRVPYVRSFDVLLQYLVTLAVSEGFRPAEVLPEVRSTYSFASMTEAEWRWCLQFITTGGHSLGAYDEYRKVEVIEGVYQVVSRRIALRHRLSIGAIVSDTTMRVKYLKGAFLGNIEEWFVAQLEPGDTFWFAGRSLKLVRVKDMTVYVRRSKAKKGRIPAWMGGRLQLSSRLGDLLRQQVAAAITRPQEPELRKLQPLLEVQQSRSIVPLEDELLIEYFKDREGYHLLVYPFEGYYVHEGLANLLAYRLGQRLPITFSIALNDYGFELLSDQEIPIHEALAEGLLSTENLTADIEAGINAGEVTKRRFRDIASIAGLIFRGYPGKQKKDRHLQASSQLFFEVFSDYEPDNLLLLQAYEEVRTFHFEEARLRAALERINRQTIRLQEPGKATPFSFPILIDRLRSRMSSEQLADRIARMKVQLVK